MALETGLRSLGLGEVTVESNTQAGRHLTQRHVFCSTQAWNPAGLLTLA